jgi:hypothetical protein
MKIGADSRHLPARGESAATEVLEHLRHEQEPRREQGGDAKTNDN